MSKLLSDLAGINGWKVVHDCDIGHLFQLIERGGLTVRGNKVVFSDDASEILKGIILEWAAMKASNA